MKKAEWLFFPGRRCWRLFLSEYVKAGQSLSPKRRIMKVRSCRSLDDPYLFVEPVSKNHMDEVGD